MTHKDVYLLTIENIFDAASKSFFQMQQQYTELNEVVGRLTVC